MGEVAFRSYVLIFFINSSTHNFFVPIVPPSDLTLGGLSFDKKKNCNVFTKVYGEALRGGQGDSGKIKMRLT